MGADRAMMRLCPIKYGVKVVDTGDPYAAYVVSLLHMNEIDGGTNNFTDEISAWTSYDINLYRTSKAKFGSTGFHSGVGDNNFSPYVDARIGQKNVTWNSEPVWTQEGWYEFDGHIPATQDFRLLSLLNSAGGGYGILVSSRNTGSIISLETVLGTSSSGISFPQDGEHHFFQIISDGATIVLGMDGVQIASVSGAATVSSTYARWCPASNNHVGGLYHCGGADEMRLTKGIARPIALPTGAFPDP